MKDFLALNRHVSNRGARRWLLVFSILCVIAFALNPLLSHIPGDHRSTFALYRSDAPLLFLPVWYFGLRLLILGLIYKRFKSAKELRAEREYALDENGLQVRGEAFSSDLKWSMFTLADCNRAYYFLRTGQNTYFYFPRLLVPDQAAFIALVENNVKCSKGWRKNTKV
jgi:hypothetical protein